MKNVYSKKCTLKGEPINKMKNALKIAHEYEGLMQAGYRNIEPPKIKPHGYEIHIKNLTLPGGVRTEIKILLPKSYPIVPPIGFYVKENAALGGLDQSHLYGDVYHDAPDLTHEGFRWFCGILDKNWTANRHNLISYMSMVLALFNENTGEKI